MGKNRNRSSNRHQAWEQRQQAANQVSQDEPQEKSELNQHFESALEHGMTDCAHDFARALGQKSAKLRAWKSGRDNPNNDVKQRVIIEAGKTGWKAPANT